MHRKILILGLIFAALSVLLGAFGAHALKSMVSGEKLQIFETGVRYQFMHAMALIALAIYANQHNLSDKEQKGIGWAAHFFIAGTLFFSGSLYILTLLSPTNHPLIRFIGPITPLGGLCFMVGWFFLIKWISRQYYFQFYTFFQIPFPSYTDNLYLLSWQIRLKAKKNPPLILLS